MSTFALDLQKFAEKCKKKADDAVGNIVVRVSAELDKRSPVGDASYWKNPPPKGYTGGRFRGAWTLGVDTIPAGESFTIDKSGEATQGAIIATIPEQAAGKVYYLVNLTPYGTAIEEGHSRRQAPQGLVGLTAIMFQQIVDDAVGALPA